MYEVFSNILLNKYILVIQPGDTNFSQIPARFFLRVTISSVSADLIQYVISWCICETGLCAMMREDSLTACCHWLRGTGYTYHLV